MPIPKTVARSNRYLLNPIFRLIAGWAPGFCILRHAGRRSGRVYAIPLNVSKAQGGFVFALTYGSDTDWVRNVVAAGGCTIRHRREEITLVRPEFLPTEEGMAHMTPMVQVVLRFLHVTEFLRLHT